MTSIWILLFVAFLLFIVGIGIIIACATGNLNEDMCAMMLLLLVFICLGFIGCVQKAIERADKIDNVRIE